MCDLQGILEDVLRLLLVILELLRFALWLFSTLLAASMTCSSEEEDELPLPAASSTCCNDVDWPPLIA